MVSAVPLSTRASMGNVQVVDDVCRSALGCGGIQVSTIALGLLTLVLAVLVLAAIVHVREAVSIVEEERARLVEERDAFDDFSRRVANLEAAVATRPVPAAGGVATVSSPVPDDDLESVRRAYRETVMDVAHYESDYGEPLAENLAAEFGDGLAVAVADGRQLTPQLKSALLEASREASRSRSSFISTLDEEAAALEEAAAAIEAVDEERTSIAAASFAERSYDDLVAEWTALGDLAGRCRGIIADRQEAIQSQAASPPDGPDLYGYLYEDLPVDHPVLADALDLSRSIETLRSRVLDALTRRV